MYSKMFSIIKQKLNHLDVPFNPNFIQIDFEKATYNGMNSEFFNAVIKGCYFHFGQSIWRRVQKHKLVNLFNTDETFYSCIHLCSTLHLVPVEEIDTSWDYILSLSPTRSEYANDLKLYIENTWLNNETSSLFFRTTWNHYETLV
ncbi:hypothetical protein DMUE_2365 [Dictyocoela muelleri]|nr:hypothetical protein DMUE_2365 [Dictyocoela muelleri]